MRASRRVKSIEEKMNLKKRYGFLTYGSFGEIKWGEVCVLGAPPYPPKPNLCFELRPEFIAWADHVGLDEKTKMVLANKLPAYKGEKSDYVPKPFPKEKMVWLTEKNKKDRYYQSHFKASTHE